MALSATFTANFSSFYDAVDKADAKLKDFGAGADKVGGRLNAMANQFSGVKIIQDATLMAKAVEEIGGVTKLTEKELAKLGSTANEAVAKMKALGMDVPKNLQAIADKTKDANKSTSDWVGTLTKVAGAVGIAFSVDAIVGFIGGIFDAASAVKDLSDQWGISTTAVQQFTGAAKQSGVESQTVGKSIQFLTEELGKGSDAYQALLANVGLSYEKLRQMPLEDAYKEVIKAIGGIKDETLQLDIAQGLLGESSKKMVGAIRDGFLEATAAQQVMSEETIARLEAAQAQWEKFTHAVVVYSGEMLGAIAASTKGMTSSWKNFFTTIGAAARDYFSGSATAAGLAANLGALDEYNDALKRNHKDIVLGVEDQKALGKGMKTSAQVAEDLARKKEALAKATAASAKAAKDAKDAQDKYNKSVDDLSDTFGGGGLIDKALLYVAALDQSIPVAKMTTTQQVAINKVMWEAIVAYERAGQVAPQVMYKIWTETAKASGAIKDFQEDLSLLWKNFAPPGKIDLGQSLTLDTIPIENQLDKLQVEWDAAMAALGAGPVPLVGIKKSIVDIGKSLGELAQISTGAFGDVVKGAASTAAAMDIASGSADLFLGGLKALGTQGGLTADNFVKTAQGAIGVGVAFLQATKGVSALQAGIQGAMVGLAVGGPFAAYTAAVGFAVGVIRTSLADADADVKYQLGKIRDELVGAAGGTEMLAARAKQAGFDLASFYNAVKAADVTDFEAQIKKMNAAFEYQAGAMDLVVTTAEKYGFTLDQLGPIFKRQELDKKAIELYQDWQVLNKAGLDTVAITEKMADSVNAYIKDAITMGVEVPTAMKPMLEAMAKSGVLMDENGEAITNLEESGINFALTMSDGFKLMVAEVKKLTDAITRGLGVAIKEIPQPQITGRVSWEVDKPPTGGSTGESQPHEVESYQHGTGGFKNFGTGTPVVLHGWEAVVPRNDAFATVTGGGGGGGAPAAPTIVINAQGAFFDTPDSLQRLATKVSDALTAKYSVMGKLRAAV